MRVQPLLLLFQIAPKPTTTPKMLDERTDVHSLPVALRLESAYVMEECRSGVPTIHLVVLTIVQCPRAFWVEEPRATSHAHRYIDVQQHWCESLDAVGATTITDMPHTTLILHEHEIDISLEQDIGIDEEESFWNKFPQLLNRHHMLVTTKVAPIGAAYLLIALWVFRQLLIEVDVFPLRVVEGLHTLHPLLPRTGIRVVEDEHFVVSTAMLPETQDGGLRQFWGVEMHNANIPCHSSWD